MKGRAGGNMDLGSPDILMNGCRFRLRSAFDSFLVASESFSEGCRRIRIGFAAQAKRRL